MNEKFMKVHKIVIHTITAVIIASQLMGCAAVSKSELLSMIDRGESIEIEVAVPTFAEQKQGEQLSELTWEELASLDTVKDLRKAWDNKLLITITDTGKNGMLYVNENGENVNNNTLRVALHNREFLKQLDDKAVLKELADIVRSQYADIDETDSDIKAVYLGINGYFNLLPDAIPNYSNADSTITRAEFMTMVMRAETAVNDELVEDMDFTNAVGASEFNRYAQEVVDSSYLDIESKSLNNQTYNGSITRAEAIYLLMNRYFSDELESVDTKGVAFNDCKDGGDIGEKQQFAGKDRAKLYELAYMLQNGVVSTDLYKALVLANQKQIILGNTCWDEAITKSEALELLIKTLRQEDKEMQFANKAGVYENEKSDTLVENGDNESLSSDGDNESLSVDVQGQDGIIDEDEEGSTEDTAGAVSEAKDAELTSEEKASVEKENEAISKAIDEKGVENVDINVVVTPVIEPTVEVSTEASTQQASSTNNSGTTVWTDPETGEVWEFKKGSGNDDSIKDTGDYSGSEWDWMNGDFVQ